MTIKNYYHINSGLYPPDFLQSKSDPFSQTASTSDCLYRFKESAQFIGFLDLEDILIPFGHSNYYSEFSFEIGGEWLHNYLVYQKLYNPKNVSITKSDSAAFFARPDHFNITKSDWNSANEYISQCHFEQSAESPKEVKINEIIRQFTQLQKIKSN
ncbi:unnamed protein product [Caenorhabditis angaria]|uniref:Glycosyltransferase family 92 protein n=1 Tax=Caenorhabditis angaria TaxID=860376 RepID=A0A9P1ITF5_9PELO|nr:unnamed protein product [Caenorhabditis angaria]